MDETILKEMASTLRDIKERVSIGSYAGIRGPVADPGPEFDLPRAWTKPWVGPVRGPVADPAPWYLLDKAKLAKLKIRSLEAGIAEIESQIGSLKLERDLLREEYKIK